MNSYAAVGGARGGRLAAQQGFANRQGSLQNWWAEMPEEIDMAGLLSRLGCFHPKAGMKTSQLTRGRFLVAPATFRAGAPRRPARARALTVHGGALGTPNHPNLRMKTS